jgi:MFS family permease
MVTLFAIYFTLGLGAVCWNIANLNYLPKVAPDAERALFISIHGAATACIGGVAPILWGLVLKSTAPDGSPNIDVTLFQWFFASVLLSSCILSVLMARLPEDTKTCVEPIIIGNALLNPVRAASYLVNLIDARSLVREVVPPRDAKK